MKKFEISEETLTAILNYLGSKPYVEVFQGIEMLKNLKEIKE